MHIRTQLQDMIFFRILCLFYPPVTRAAYLGLSLILVGCSTNHIVQTSRYEETKLQLQSANFVTDVVYATGEANCMYILFSIPVCKHQNIATVAWDKMRFEAQMEGKPAQLINVLEDRYLRWNFLYLIYQEHYSVSASVIVYKQPDQ